MNNKMNELLQRELKEDETPPISYFGFIQIRNQFKAPVCCVIMGVKLLH